MRVSFLFLVLAACTAVAGPDAPAPADDPRLVIGTFRLAEDGVVDGDTLRVDGLKRSLRILSIDTEEKAENWRTAAELLELMRTDFPAYVERVTEDEPLPVKFATPLGERASEWAERALRPGATLRLERDYPGQGRDEYGRTLCHVWVVPAEGRPWLYGLEAVRAGMTPYFVKYGRSRRFDAALRAAQAEARAARRGIWEPGAPHYPDYARRLAWWTRRADALDAYERVQDAPDAPVRLGDRRAIRILSSRVGSDVAVFGLVDDHDARAVRRHAGGATIRLGGRRHIEIEIVGSSLAERLAPERWHGEFLVVSGPLDRKGSVLNERLRFLRIPVTRPAQIRPGSEVAGNGG